LSREILKAISNMLQDRKYTAVIRIERRKGKRRRIKPFQRQPSQKMRNCVTLVCIL
jgi:hypothetical protein